MIIRIINFSMYFRLLEQKHSEQLKKLTFQWSVEREQLTNQNLKMEKQLEQLLHDETKLRTEVASLKQVSAIRHSKSLRMN